MTNYIVEKLARLLLVDLDVFEPDVTPIAEQGLHSMIGAELRNRIFKELALDIPFQQFLGPGLIITKFAIQVCANQCQVLEEWRLVAFIWWQFVVLPFALALKAF